MCRRAEERSSGMMRKQGTVPHFLRGKNPDEQTFAKMYNLPLEAALGGAQTLYPEYRKKLKGVYTPLTKCTRYCCGWGGGNPRASGLKCVVGAVQ